ncbi:MAG: hypothetical protein ACFN3H_03845 [Spirochaetales bacterium]
MKKAGIISIVIVLCALLCSCATKAPKEDAVHVTTFAEFTEAFKLAKEDPLKTKIVLDNDIVWDFTLYSGGDYVFMPDATGLDIDLCGFSILEVPKNALNLTGSAFTLENGSIIASEANDRYSVTINYEGTNGLKDMALAHVPGSYDDADPVWADRIIVRNITATGMLCGYSTMEITDCNFIDGKYRGLVMQGSSGIVENVNATTREDAGSAGFVAHSYGTVLVKGSCEFKGKFGIYSAQCSTLSFAEGATVNVGAWATYGIYLEKQSLATVGTGVTIMPAEGKQTVYARTGSTLVIEKGAVIKDGTCIELPAPIQAENINIDDTVGASDDAWAGAGMKASIVDNR